MNDTEKATNFGEMMDATVNAARKITKPWIIALIVTNALWAIIVFTLVWFAYMAPTEVDVNQGQDFENQTQSQTYHYEERTTPGD